MTVEFEDAIDDMKLIPVGQRMMEKLLRQNNTLLINGTTYSVSSCFYDVIILPYYVL